MADKYLENKNKVVEFFQSLGLSNYESTVYQLLLKNRRAVSMLFISENTNVPRTNAYRICGQLRRLGLIEEIVKDKKKLVRASDLSHLELLVKDQKQKAFELGSSLPIIKKILTPQNAPQEGKTQISYFKGKDGIKQLLWNSLKAREILGYSFLAYEDSTDKKFAKKYREERWLRKIKNRDLLSDNDKYLTEKNLRLTKNLKVFALYRARYLPARKVNINHDLIVYNDVVAFYSWHKGEIFGVEIQNQDIAQLQKQVFELLWYQAKEPGTIIKSRKN
ncbi:MAG: hypothetical protein A2418_01835 [Candidatus Brennerbacteria bacterium RIFOXYC1_FULL_41_11]|uniref:Transcription regulator TrmB N-terminal domain-containing protein n=1 Tax=Candidatus Brennerbacteria bacterium RIFOXYD1_FULL_41_16 TaxID=1797529 RepID=A0A1G1XLB1_9BACT|nr:MAG: hypothetical protein UU61_C0001G0024 [Parcubacteria group bacterium GW2011_GWB1_41_4]OGY39588.1 MAG: hypothetical protein A2391_01190 [Candidatus Brennerbacteria bacterium RIFOXYB1_FULL_41_13]OGY39893.1 MAG: hypothetical protein A2418_01835 [Candidatus Brennerbacteria bacterium RIFOXYC1_FULL_41_11]OGY40704.1 MAG: hypothetical protein A2570_01050 [Candidatus Brennerbacteria bacterium RIFOXYD1_FULL_41_16]